MGRLKEAEVMLEGKSGEELQSMMEDRERRHVFSPLSRYAVPSLPRHTFVYPS
jgi:hypothetical protein